MKTELCTHSISAVVFISYHASEIFILHTSANFEKSKAQIFSNKYVFSNQLILGSMFYIIKNNTAASSEFGTYCLCEQRWFRRTCASTQSRQNLRCSLIQAVSQESRGTFRQKARSLLPLNDWACAVKICHDGMLEDTNSLDAALLYFNRVPSSVDLIITKVIIFLASGISTSPRWVC